MPIYTYRCFECKRDTELFSDIEGRDNLVGCGICGERMHRIPTFRGGVYAPTAKGGLAT